MTSAYKPNFALAAYTLCRREIVRFYRQKSRMIGVIASPLVFWYLIGSGLGTSFRNTGAPAVANYLEYFFPGTVVLIILFSAIFSTISIIEDRREGFLQSVIVAPVSRGSIAMGKIMGGTILSMLQAAILLLLAPFIGLHLSIYSLFLIVGMLFIISFGLTGLGFIIAWRMESTQGFHAIMNLFLVPLWLMSGALFPPSGAAGWLGTVMLVNPLTYGVEGLRAILYMNADLSGTFVTTIPLSFVIVTAFSLVMFGVATWTVNRK